MVKVNFDTDFVENQRLNFYLKQYKIGLDVDEVLADFIGGYKEKYKDRLHKDIFNWYFSYSTTNIIQELKTDKEFWLGLKPRITYLEIPFIPKCYISKRNFPIEWTQEWLEMHHFPCMPVIHVEDDKTEAFKAQELDYFIDDSISNFQRLNANGCKTFLMDASHNKQFDVGNYRLSTLQDVIYKI